MRTRYLVCYDIADPARLGRVYRFLKGEGVALQYSVFLCSLTWPELERVKERMAELIEAETDDVRIYPLPSGDVIHALGRPSRAPVGAALFLS
jgi:CRISPR-associated protein Cas2